MRYLTLKRYRGYLLTYGCTMQVSPTHLSERLICKARQTSGSLPKEVARVSLPVKIFVCNSVADEKYRKRLEVHLAPLKRDGLITVWHERLILPSSDIAIEVQQHLLDADLVLILVSPDLLASDDDLENKLKVALERHLAGAARVIPIVVRRTDYHSTAFARVAALPSNGNPINAWSKADDAWLDVVQGIRRVIDAFRTMQHSPASSSGASSEHDKRDPNPSNHIKVLFLGAGPTDQIRLALGKEVREIRKNLRESEGGRRFAFVEEWAVRPTELQAALLRHEPQIVHFSGHGDNSGELMFEGDDGRSRPAPVVAVARLFSLCSKGIRCVVLNACYSDAQAQAMRDHIDCVIGMKSAIPDDAALSFSSSFYLALGHGKTVQDAFDFGCNQIELTGTSGANLPTLLCRPGIEPSKVKLSP